MPGDSSTGNSIGAWSAMVGTPAPPASFQKASPWRARTAWGTASGTHAARSAVPAPGTIVAAANTVQRTRGRTAVRWRTQLATMPAPKAITSTRPTRKGAPGSSLAACRTSAIWGT